MKIGHVVKIGLRESVVILFLFLCIFLAYYAIRLTVTRAIGTGTTVPEATRLVNDVIGTEAINKDAEKLLDQFKKTVCV